MSDRKRTKVSLNVDLPLLAIFLLSLATRYYKLDHPKAIVFDELHYIKFITLYLKRIFYFDAQPPLGKQIISIASYLSGFNGDLGYSQIGEALRPDVPIHHMRLVPCICGTLIAPLFYLVSLELGFHQAIAGLVSILVITENSLLTQSRFILLEPIILLLTVSSIYCYLKFRKTYSEPWLGLASLLTTLAFCTKYSGFHSHIFLLGLVIHNWWQSIELTEPKILLRRAFTYSVLLVIIPVVIYVAIYYAHLSWLTKAGPHDHIMTSAFQASLEDGLASITQGQPLEIVHGSQITLRHTHGRSCWLHSHEHLYPIKYSDGRGSSHQQQVTCYTFKDVNNWWIVKRPDLDELLVTEPLSRVKDNDMVQLIHGLTGRALNSHDVASAMSPFSQEVSCYVDHNISMPAQNLWLIRLSNPEATGGYWHTLHSRVQLIHANSSLALRFSGRQLPDWGFHQHEVVADKELKNDDTIWNVEEHRYTKSDDQTEREIQLGHAEFVPLEPTKLNFFEKFYELHYKLLTYQQDSLKDHIYASDSPIDWVLLNRGTAYWVDGASESNAQIFLIGNVDIYRLGLVSIGLLISIFLHCIICRRRKALDGIFSKLWPKVQLHTTVLLGGYLAHLLPFFLYEPPLFLQCYLNALVFKILIIGALFDYFLELSSWKITFYGLSVAILIKVIGTFFSLSPLSYGFELTDSQVEELKWKETWQLISSVS